MDEATGVFLKLTEEAPELPEPYNNLAVIYAQQKQYDKAKAALEMAIRTHPSYAVAHENLGDLYAKMARQAYDRALQIDAGNASAQEQAQPDPGHHIGWQSPRPCSDNNRSNGLAGCKQARCCRLLRQNLPNRRHVRHQHPHLRRRRRPDLPQPTTASPTRRSCTNTTPSRCQHKCLQQQPNRFLCLRHNRNLPNPLRLRSPNHRSPQSQWLS